ncbi:type II toxin-antitoxin system VapC family toxin [[Eubacterium] cellulosolvens]
MRVEHFESSPLSNPVLLPQPDGNGCLPLSGYDYLFGHTESEYYSRRVLHKPSFLQLGHGRSGDLKFLFDASSLLQVIRSFREEKALRILAQNCILDLTKYEVGNALWKEQVLHRTIGEDDFQEFLNLLGVVVVRTKALTVDAKKLREVAEVAARQRITFYDASYIMVAKAHGLVLITEDNQLARAASTHVETSTAAKIKAI